VCAAAAAAASIGGGEKRKKERFLRPMDRKKKETIANKGGGASAIASKAKYTHTHTQDRTPAEVVGMHRAVCASKPTIEIDIYSIRWRLSIIRPSLSLSLPPLLTK
jgi:hypothetical protein